MASFRLALIGFPIAWMSATALRAHEATPPPPIDAPPSGNGQGSVAARQAPALTIPPNVTITTPDGKPLPPDLLRRVLKVLDSDPAVRTLLDAATPATVKTKVDGTAIVVTARKPRGSVLGDVPPQRTFNPLDIRAYGARDIGELITDLGTEVKSSQGVSDRPPIVLLNGKRISDFQEIADYPTEAIERLEVFSEDLALQYGYPADRKVVNVVTFDPFSSRNAYANYDLPTSGGGDRLGLNGRYLHIAGRSRYKLSFGYEAGQRLLESQRHVVEPPGASNEAQYRTLLPQSEQLTFGGSISDDIADGVPVTIKGDLSSSRTTALFGLGRDRPLQQHTNTLAGSLGAALSGRLKRWLWSSTSTYDRVESKTSTDSATAAGGQDRARALAGAFATDVSLTGSPFRLPAGTVSAALRIAYSRNDFHSRLQRDGIDQSARLRRNQGTVFADVNVPLASRRARSLAWLGNLSANAQIGFERLTEFKTLSSYGFGIYWSPVEAFRLRASSAHQQDAPLLEQLGAPLVATPNVRTFDYARAETVDVTRIVGGNRFLGSDDRHVMNVGFSLKPFRGKNIDVVADYTKTKIDNPVAPFPILTQPVQDAFPERFTRDSSGRLTSINMSPINFVQSNQSQVRWGINLTKSLGQLPNGSDIIFSPVTDGTIPPGTLPPNSKVIDNPPGTPLPPEIENAISRIYFSFYHTYHLQDTVVLRDRSVVLNLLNGFALDSHGGQSRHELTFSAGLFKHGAGARINVRWQSPTTIRGLSTEAGPIAAKLHFTYPPVADIYLFVIPQDRLNGGGPGWLKGVQIGLNITNILDTRPIVRDQSGSTPLDYQPAYLDPIGRSVHLSIRKLF